MNGHGDARSDPLVHAPQLVPARVSGNVDGVFGHAIGNDVYAAIGEGVLKLKDALLISWNDAGGENHDIAVAERNMSVIIAGDSAEGCARLSLAAGAQVEDVVIGQRTGVFFIDEIRDVIEEANRPCRIRNLVHRATDETNAAPAGRCGTNHAFHARDVGRECRDGNASGLLCNEIY